MPFLKSPSLFGKVRISAFAKLRIQRIVQCGPDTRLGAARAPGPFCGGSEDPSEVSEVRPRLEVVEDAYAEIVDTKTARKANPFTLIYTAVAFALTVSASEVEPAAKPRTKIWMRCGTACVSAAWDQGRPREIRAGSASDRVDSRLRSHRRIASCDDAKLSVR